MVALNGPPAHSYSGHDRLQCRSLAIEPAARGGLSYRGCFFFRCAEACYCTIVGVNVHVQFSAPFIEKLFPSEETETGPPCASSGIPRILGSAGPTCTTTSSRAPGIGRMEQPPG